MHTTMKRTEKKYGLEVEFFVAQQREHIDENDVADDAAHRWTCTSQADDAKSEIARQCQQVLREEHGPVIIRLNEEHTTGRSWQSARFDAHILQPCSITSDGDDGRHDWHGFKLRSALVNGTVAESLATTQQCIQALETSVHFDMTPNCRFNVSMQPANGSLSLLEAKKLVSILWLLEPDMIDGTPSMANDLRPITRHSSLALDEHSSSKPNDPLLLTMLERHVPGRMHDTGQQAQLHRLWGLTSLRDVSKALRTPSNEALDFEVRVYDDDDADDDGNVEGRAVATFRYVRLVAREDMAPWTQTVSCVSDAMSLPPGQYKKLLRDLDELRCAEEQGQSRWNKLIKRLRDDDEVLPQEGDS